MKRDTSILFNDLKSVNSEYIDGFSFVLQQALHQDFLVHGAACSTFEKSFATYCHTEFCVGVGNGLDAITIALMALGIGVGDEVIVQSTTYIATALAVSRLGATPVLVDPISNPAFFSNADEIIPSITERTKAVIVTHLYGHIAPISEIYHELHGRGIFVIDDCAQAHGGTDFGKYIGGLCDASCWSFYPGKILGALGDGGAITTNNKELSDKCRLLGNYGSEVKYHNRLKGYNSRLDTIQAAFLSLKLKNLDRDIATRRKLSARYLEQLANYESSGLSIIAPSAGLESSVWHLFGVQLGDRDRCGVELAKLGVQTLSHYPIPIHHQPAYSEYAHMKFPIAEDFSNRCLSLPLHTKMTLEDVDYVCDKLGAALRGRGGSF